MKKIEKKENGRTRVHTVNTKPSKTDPSWKNDCCVNSIMKRFTQTGQISHLAKRPGQYADVSGASNLHEMLTVAKDAQTAFARLPAEVRKFYGNDLRNAESALSEEALKDPKRRALAEKLGLIEKQPEPKTPAPKDSGGAGGSQPQGGAPETSKQDPGVSKTPA